MPGRGNASDRKVDTVPQADVYQNTLSYANTMSQMGTSGAKSNIVLQMSENSSKSNVVSQSSTVGMEKNTTTGSMENDIVNALKQADLPASEANMEEGKKAYEAAKEMLPLTEAAKEYMLKNEWEPTIKNLYLASHSGISTKNPMINFTGLEKQIEKVIKDAGIPNLTMDDVYKFLVRQVVWAPDKEALRLNMNNLLDELFDNSI